MVFLDRTLQNSSRSSRMIAFAFTLFAYLGFSQALAKRVDPDHPKALSLILLFVFCLLSVEVLGAFQIFSTGPLLFLAVLALLGMVGLEKEALKEPHQNLKIFGLATLFGALLFYPSLLPLAETDSFAYHLPIVQQLVETHSVWDVFFAGFVGPNTYFPANHEALQAFLALQTGHYDLGFLVTLTAFALFFLSLKELIQNRQSSVYALIFILSAGGVPFLFQEFLSFQIDLFSFFLFGSALCFFSSSYLQNKKIDFAKGCLLLGLCLGSKYNALPQVLVLIPFLFALTLHQKTQLKHYLTYGALTLLPGLFWYLRNGILTGNPLYPFGLDLGPLHWEGYQILVKETENTSLWSHLFSDGPQTLLNQILNNAEFSNELGGIALGLLALGLGTSVFLMCSNKKRPYQILGLSLLLIFVGELLAYLTAPYTFTLWNQTIRYSATLFALLPVLFAVSTLRSKQVGKILLLISGLLFLYQISTHSFITSSSTIDFLAQKGQAYGLLLTPFILAWIGGLSFHPSLKGGKRYLGLGFFTLCLSGFAFGILPILKTVGTPEENYLIEKLPGYEELLPVLKTLREESNSSRTVLAITGLTPYALFEQEGFDTLYLNTDGCLDCNYHDYRKDTPSIRSFPNEEAWKTALLQKEVSFLLISTSYEPNITMVEKEWAQKDPTQFTLLLETGPLSLYKVNAPLTVHAKY